MLRILSLVARPVETVQRERTERTKEEKDRTKRVAVAATVTQKQKRCDVHTEPQTDKLNTQHKIVIYFNTKMIIFFVRVLPPPCARNIRHPVARIWCWGGWNSTNARAIA